MLRINKSFNSNLDYNDLYYISKYFKSMFSGNYIENKFNTLDIIIPTISNKDEWYNIEKIIINNENIMFYKWIKISNLYKDFISNSDIYKVYRHDFEFNQNSLNIQFLSLSNYFKSDNLNYYNISLTGKIFIILKIIEIMILMKKIDKPYFIYNNDFNKESVLLFTCKLKDDQIDFYKPTLNNTNLIYKFKYFRNKNTNINFVFPLCNKTFEPITIIQTLSYLQIDELLNKYIISLKKFILNYKYSVVSNNARLLCCIMDCVDDIYTDFDISCIFNYHNFKISKEYIDLGMNILKQGDISYCTRNILLQFWSKNFHNLEKFTHTCLNYFKLDDLKYNGFNLPSTDEFIKVAEEKTIWGKFLKNYLPNNCIISGGFIPICIKDLEIHKFNDIDLWIYGEDDEIRKKSFNNLLSSLNNFINKNKFTRYIKNYYITIRKSIVSVHIENEISLQIIFTDKKKPIDIISNFDMNYLQSFYIKEFDTYHCYLSSQAINCYLTNSTNYILEKKNIKPSRLLKTIKKGFQIKNLIDEVRDIIKNIDFYDEWTDTKNKYFDNYTNDINRNNFLLKNIYKASFVVNCFDQIPIYFDYIPFNYDHYNTYNSSNDIKLPELNKFITFSEKEFYRTGFYPDETYFKFDKNIILSDIPLMECNRYTIEHKIHLNPKSNYNYFMSIFKKKVDKIMNSITKYYSVNINLVDNTPCIFNKFNNKYFLEFKINNNTKIFNSENIIIKSENNPFDLYDNISLTKSFNNKYMKFDLLFKGIFLKLKDDLH